MDLQGEGRRRGFWTFGGSPKGRYLWKVFRGRCSEVGAKCPPVIHAQSYRVRVDDGEEYVVCELGVGRRLNARLTREKVGL